MTDMSRIYIKQFLVSSRFSTLGPTMSLATESASAKGTSWLPDDSGALINGWISGVPRQSTKCIVKFCLALTRFEARQCRHAQVAASNCRSSALQSKVTASTCDRKTRRTLPSSTGPRRQKPSVFRGRQACRLNWGNFRGSRERLFFAWSRPPHSCQHATAPAKRRSQLQQRISSFFSSIRTLWNLA